MTSAVLDAIVLSVLIEEPLRFHDVYLGLHRKFGYLTPDRRKVDRSLQRLRKSGKVKLVKGRGGGWRIPMPAMPANKET